MRKKLIKYTVLTVTVIFALNACGLKNTARNESGAQIDISSDANEEQHDAGDYQSTTQADMDSGKEDTEKTTETIVEESLEQKSGFFAHWEYAGYEDEWNWGGDEPFMFANQDYDNDGLYDRIYREMRGDTEFCHYRFELGNGIVIDMDKDTYSTGFPHVKAADINGDGENEIIFFLTYDTSTDMRAFGDMVVYEKHGDSYEKANLPFHEGGEGYTQEIPVHYEVVRDRLVKVTVEGEKYETLVPINDYQWEELSYGTQFDDLTENGRVWDNYLIEDDGKTQLVCKLHLFDKWSNYGLFAVLSYEDGNYIVDRWLRTNDEFDNAIDTDSFWEIGDYRLCTQVMETDSGKVNAELWLDKGVYGSGEEFAWGGGVYEENFEGEYHLVVKDADGNILSEQNMGKMNFSGSFEISVGDYNQDSCPDFTIGAYGSSSVSIYTLYTIWKDGQIGVIGREIPNCGGDFSIAFEGSGDKAFYGSIYDNAIGEMIQIAYEWDEEQKMFVEKNSD